MSVLLAQRVIKCTSPHSDRIGITATNLFRKLSLKEGLIRKVHPAPRSSNANPALLTKSRRPIRGEKRRFASQQRLANRCHAWPFRVRLTAIFQVQFYEPIVASQIMVVKFAFAVCLMLRFRFAASAFCMLWLLPLCAHSQSKPSDAAKGELKSSKPITWQAACKALESDDPAEIENTVEILHSALKDPARVEEMACALTLLFYRLEDESGAQRTLAGIRTAFPNASNETQSFVLRMQLPVLLSQSKDETSQQLVKQVTATFRDLVLRTWKDKTLTASTMRANAATVGMTCGMLRSKLAGEVLTTKDLDVAEKCMLECDEKEVSSSFKLALAEATQRAKGMEAIIERVKKDPLAASAEQEVRKQRLADMGVDFKDKEDAARQALRVVRDLEKQNSIERRQIGDLLRRLEREWKNVTPGHPGTPPTRPKEPKRSDVHVDSFEGTGKDRREKSRDEIRREEDLAFDRLERIYDNQFDKYSRAAAQYQTQLNDWNHRDTTRRTALKNQQVAALTRQQQLLEADRQIDGDKSDAADEVQAQHAEQEKLAKEAAEYEMTQIALDAIKKESTYIAFRPPHFDLINIDSECAMLLNRIRSIK